MSNGFDIRLPFIFNTSTKYKLIAIVAVHTKEAIWKNWTIIPCATQYEFSTYTGMDNQAIELHRSQTLMIH